MKKYKATLATFLILSAFLMPSFSYAEETTQNVADSTDHICINLSTSLRYKMRDTGGKKDIWNLQTFLQKQKFITTNPTGYFGSATLKGVKDFQKKYRVPTTGLVGSITRSKIAAISCISVHTETNTPVNNISVETPANNTTTTNTNTTTTETTSTTNTNNDEILTAPNNSSLRVRTEGIVSNSNTSATLRGNITAGARSATTRWIEVTKNPSVYKVSETIQSSKIRQVSNGRFDVAVPSLSASTTYYYRACAENLDLGQKSCGDTAYFSTSN